MTVHRNSATRYAFGALVSTCVIVVGAGLIVLIPPGLAAEIQETQSNKIGYATVAEALAALRSRPGVEISQQGGWTIVSERATGTLWSFTPPGNPAHPSAIKRAIVSSDGSTQIDMNVLCEATKAACDKLVTEFQQLNQRNWLARPGVEAA
jgi:hypothetical protein